ncbi:MAG: hypothetical protein OXD54_03900 [Candidatus Poribacteria bacterium]|nr:hypothetical protein [Candidatus Poribacteria bacterium]
MYKANPTFWDCYDKLPPRIQKLADKNYELLKQDQSHPSLELKRVQDWWSARVGDNYRALAYETEGYWVWFWIGNHDEYMKLIRSKRRR